MIEGTLTTFLSREMAMTDNWDLSAKRATAIVRALLKNGNIDPARISASGRAEFDPLDKSKTKEAASEIGVPKLYSAPIWMNCLM